MTLPFPAPYNSVSLTRFRESLPSLVRKLLSEIWEHHVSKNEWISVPELHRRFADPEGEELLENLGSTVVLKNKSYGLYNYELTILGVILAEKGEQDEARLVRYLEYIRNRHQNDLEFNRVTAEELQKDWNVDESEAFRISRLVGLARFCYLPGSELSYHRWHVSLPPFIHQLQNVQNFGQLIHLRALEIGLYESGVTPGFTDDIRTIERDLADFENQQAGQSATIDYDEIPEPEKQELDPAQNIFRLNGDYWEIQFRGKDIHLKRIQGLEYIAQLLRNPGRYVPCSEFNPVFSGSGNSKSQDEGLSIYERHQEGIPLSDDKTKRLLQTKIKALEELIERARRAGDAAEIKKLSQEKDFIQKQLNADFDKRGRIRVRSRPSDMERKRVRRTIITVFDNLKKRLPELEKYLRNNIKLGYDCCYTPKDGVEWIFD